MREAIHNIAGKQFREHRYFYENAAMSTEDIVQELLFNIYNEELTEPGLQVRNAQLRAIDLGRRISNTKRIYHADLSIDDNPELIDKLVKDGKATIIH